LQDKRDMGILFSWRTSGILFICWFAISSCADLSAIRKFSSISMESENYTRLTEDSVNIMERMKFFQEQKDKADFEKFKKDMEELKPGMLALNQLVSKYMNALGELASDKLIPYDKSYVDGLKSEVENSPAVKRGYITKPTVEAAADLTDLLIKAMTEAYRQAKLLEVIGKANTPLQTILADQKRIIQIYKTNLNAELNYVNNYYGNIIRKLNVYSQQEERKLSGSKNWTSDVIYSLGNIICDENAPLEKRVALVPLRNEMQAKLKEYKTRMKAADDYIAVLDNIQKGHQQLYDMRNQIKSKMLLSTIDSYSAAIQKLYQDLIALK
jgi:hypothetical protein